MRTTGLTPSPGDVAIVRAILPQFTDQAGIDWAMPLADWSEDVMTDFLLLAWQLITKAEAALNHGPGKIIRRSQMEPNDAVPFVP